MILCVVALVDDQPEDGLRAGVVGTVVHVFHEPQLAYEVEFVDDDGATIAVITLNPDRVRVVA